MTTTRKKRTIKRNIKRRRNGKSQKRRVLKGGNTSSWSDYKSLVSKKIITNQDICPLCQETFSQTRDKVIYKLICCGQLAHNDCVLNYCDDKSRRQDEEIRRNWSMGAPYPPLTIKATCPMCRKEEGDPSLKRGYCGFICDCMEVSAFKGKDFSDEDIKRMLGEDSRVFRMYQAQP